MADTGTTERWSSGHPDCDRRWARGLDVERISLVVNYDIPMVLSLTFTVSVVLVVRAVLAVAAVR